jgi:hypothetical protein
VSIDLRYPIGPFEERAAITTEMRESAVVTIAELPSRMRAAIAGLSDAQLDTAYRQDGWTVRQLVHHVADSHVNAYVRTKLGLTEQEPTIKPYDQDLWVAVVRQSTSGGRISLDSRRSARAMDRALALADSCGIRANLQAPGARARDARLPAADVCMAFASSRRAHHRTPAARRLADQAVGAPRDRDETSGRARSRVE